jgi:translation initiation factor IF-2
MSELVFVVAIADATCSAMIIYHLFDAFTKYMSEVQEAKRLAAMPNAVWPCRLKILKAFAHRDPIILGCDLIEGTMRTGTPVGVRGDHADLALKNLTADVVQHFH